MTPTTHPVHWTEHTKIIAVAFQYSLDGLADLPQRDKIELSGQILTQLVDLVSQAPAEPGLAREALSRARDACEQSLLSIPATALAAH